MERRLLLYNSGSRQQMAEITIHPSFKPLLPLYLLGAFLFVVTAVYITYTGSPYWWLLGIPLLIDVWAVSKHLLLRSTKLVISGDLIKYESGLAAKQQRTIVIQKLQDVRVDQSVVERILGIGTLSLETAGETSRLTIEGIDNPGQIAAMLHDKMQHKG